MEGTYLQLVIQMRLLKLQFLEFELRNRELDLRAECRDKQLELQTKQLSVLNRGVIVSIARLLRILTAAGILTYGIINIINIGSGRVS